MVSTLVSAVLAWLHILSAIGWMGSAMFLAMVLGPSTRELPPPSRRDLVLRLFPRFIRYVTIFATLTLVFGVLLGMGLVSDGSEVLSPSTTWGLRIINRSIPSIRRIRLGTCGRAPIRARNLE